jgi:hypothetical protein
MHVNLYPIRAEALDEFYLNVRFRLGETRTFNSLDDIMAFYLNSSPVKVYRYPYAVANWGLLTESFTFGGRVANKGWVAPSLRPPYAG